MAGDDVVTAKLSLVLSAFNNCASKTSLNITNVNITDKSISITGDTSSSDNTLKFLRPFVRPTSISCSSVSPSNREEAPSTLRWSRKIRDDGRT